MFFMQAPNVYRILCLAQWIKLRHNKDLAGKVRSRMGTQLTIVCSMDHGRHYEDS